MPLPIACARRLVALSMLFAIAVATPMIGRAAEDGLEVANFAGGCFWCVESDFDNVPGVERTVSGYTGGDLANPTYKQVSAGGTGHLEAVQIFFDPDKVTYEKLLDVLWHSIDPTDDGGQFCDRGESYKTAVFANSPEQKQSAENSRRELEKSARLSRPVVTAIESAGAFYPAEDYHQGYYQKNPLRYKWYRYRCGRDARLKDLWGEDALRGIAQH